MVVAHVNEYVHAYSIRDCVIGRSLRRERKETFVRAKDFAENESLSSAKCCRQNVCHNLIKSHAAVKQ